MRAYKDRISLSKFPEAFAMRFGQYIKPDYVGYTKMEELLTSMSDIIDVKPLSSGDECIVQLTLASGAIFQGFCIMCLVIHMVFIIIINIINEYPEAGRGLYFRPK